MLDNDKYQKYFDQYSDYSSKYLLGNKYCSLGKKITKTKYYQILYYKTLASQDCIISNKRIFLVIPSIFNSPEILFLAKSKSFVGNLRHCGEVFLVDWFEVDEADYLLEDYVKRVVEIISNLRQKNYQIDLVGHCIGGIIGMAATIIVPNMIRTLTLLSTPWDFSHFATARNIYQYLGLDYYVRNLPMIPKLHIQILFFLLMPNYFSTKLDKFFTITVPKIRDLSFRVENWLMSGTALSRNTYIQIMDDVVGNNMLAKLQWKVNNIIIDPTLINKPVYQIIASNDKIVPKSSMLSLHKLFRESMIFEVPSGHISYLINNNLDTLFKEYIR
ncbi:MULTISPECIES: alpha/beta fold hydrolase [unclassified Candidatus Tisiphia]|uniref:alpha/beta fold hydrolase n=1 Tax=unclassified Candidatus Tisiphia TaxID=2996318 RepID=UPI0035C8FB15